MRGLIRILGTTVLAILSVTSVGAQEVGQEVTLTGCLAQEEEEMGDEMEREFLLKQVTGMDVEAEVVELLPEEGVNLTPHVGHTVEVAGTVVSDDHEEMEEGEMDEEGMDEGDELHIRVSKLSHMAASCQEGP